MKKLILLLLILTLTSWTYKKPKKDKHPKHEHHTLPVGDGTIFMVGLVVLYGINKYAHNGVTLILFTTLMYGIKKGAVK